MAELADALRYEHASSHEDLALDDEMWTDLAAALLPVVLADRRRAVAEALRETAFGLDNCADEQSGWCGPLHDYSDGLSARAAAVEGGGR